ncbi:hypothetical protein AB0K48_33910, partial [Nonomuraea sp. NPDC055795]
MDDSRDGMRADTLVATVRGVLPSLTPAAQTVARLILEDPATVARSTITELSAASGTSEATIVRTARLLGFAGYPQLRLADDPGARVHLLQHVRARAQPLA